MMVNYLSADFIEKAGSIKAAKLSRLNFDANRYHDIQTLVIFGGRGRQKSVLAKTSAAPMRRRSLRSYHHLPD